MYKYIYQKPQHVQIAENGLKFILLKSGLQRKALRNGDLLEGIYLSFNPRILPPHNTITSSDLLL